MIQDSEYNVMQYQIILLYMSNGKDNLLCAYALMESHMSFLSADAFIILRKLSRDGSKYNAWIRAWVHTPYPYLPIHTLIHKL